MRKKLRNSGGLTTVEMLCAVLILVLLCLLMNAGLGMAVKSYRDITAKSEAELLLSTLSDALSDKLRYASVKVGSGGVYQSCSVGDLTVDSDGKVLLGGSRLLPDGAYGEGRYRFSPETKITGFASGCFSLELKIEDKTGTVLAETTLTVRCLNPPKEA